MTLYGGIGDSAKVGDLIVKVDRPDWGTWRVTLDCGPWFDVDRGGDSVVVFKTDSSWRIYK
jgi:hypothetical protein